MWSNTSKASKLVCASLTTYSLRMKPNIPECMPCYKKALDVYSLYIAVTWDENCWMDSWLDYVNDGDHKHEDMNAQQKGNHLCPTCARRLKVYSQEEIDKALSEAAEAHGTDFTERWQDEAILLAKLDKKNVPR